MNLHSAFSAVARVFFPPKEEPSFVPAKRPKKTERTIDQLKAEIAKARAHHRPVAHLHAKLREAVNRELKTYNRKRKRSAA